MELAVSGISGLVGGDFVVLGDLVFDLNFCLFCSGTC